jgi:hypothetical protein
MTRKQKQSQKRTRTFPPATTIYRYGWMAWFWRLLVLPGAVAGALAIWYGVRLDSLSLIVMGIALLGPSYFFGMTLAVRIDRMDGSRLRISTLLFWRRYLDRSKFGTPRFREKYHDEYSTMYAPRLWQPVRGHLPIYIDLLGDIPDGDVFRLFFHVPPGVIRSRRRDEPAEGGDGVTLDPDTNAP